MKLKARKGFKRVIWFLDLINPYVVVVSIIGLVLEFTGWRGYVIDFNGFIDLLFLIDFLVRLAAFPAKKYFIYGYGWVDMLAALPGMEKFFKYTVPSLFKVFKLLRIGRFFKIIRILRFLRVFSFLRKMKADSPYIQDRLMKIGITIVLVSVVGIGFTDIYVTDMYKDTFRRQINKIDKTEISFKNLPAEVKAFRVNNKLQALKNKKSELVDQQSYRAMKTLDRILVVAVEPGMEFILHDEVYIENKNAIMLSLMLTLIIIIVFIIFVIGYYLARDIKLVNLIIDSIDADEYMLLCNEGENYKDENGNFEPEENEQEITVLFKMVNKLIREKHIGEGLQMPGVQEEFQFDGVDDVIDDSDEQKSTDEEMDIAEADSMLDQMESETAEPEDEEDTAESQTKGTEAAIRKNDLKEIIRNENETLKQALIEELKAYNEQLSSKAAGDAVKISAKSIINYIKRNT